MSLMDFSCVWQSGWCAKKCRWNSPPEQAWLLWARVKKKHWGWL